MNYRYLKTTYLVLFLLVAVCAVGSFSIPDTANAAVIKRPPNNLGLVGYWMFDEGTGNSVGDFSGQGNDGATNGDPQWVGGRFGNALEFDGDGDGVDAGVDSSITDLPTTGFTVSVWIKKESSDSKPIVGRWDETNDDRIWTIEKTSSAGYSFTTSNDGKFDSGNRAGSSVHTTGEWVHVTGVYEDTHNRIYINGVEEGNVDRSSDGIHDNDLIPFRIGLSPEHFGVENIGFDGLIDDVRVYSRALSASEIADLYNRSGRVIRNASTKNKYTDGLIAHWTFDGPDMTSATTTDVFGSYDGSIVGNPVRRIGVAGQALRFDGVGDIVEVEKDADIEFTGLEPFTISTWFRATDSATGFQGLLSDLHTGGGIRFMVHSPNENLYLQVRNSDGDINSANTSIAGRYDEWVHGAGVFDGSQLLLYVDGQIQDTQSLTIGSIGESSQSVYSIGYSSNNTSYYEGLIDDLRVYDRALSDDEITGLYNATKPITENAPRNNQLTDGLVGYWTFDGPDLTSTTATDVSANSNDGTLNGDAAPGIGKIGQAISLDGDGDYVEASDSDSLDWSAAENLSLSLWIKPSVDEGGPRLIAKRSGGLGDGYNLQIASNGILVFTLLSDADTFQVASTAAGGISAGEWYHVAVSADRSSDVRIYIDGELADTGDWQGSGWEDHDFSNTNPLRIGTLTAASANFDGNIDDVRIYSRALSADEIQRLYQMGR